MSHWWGEPVLSMIKCLKRNALDRGLDHDSPFWICAYANNQWTLGGEISADPSDSSFHRAMRICEGTVSIVDEKCETYKRSWCLYELFISSSHNGGDYKLDMYTECEYENHWGEKFDAVGITDGFIKSDKESTGYKKKREKYFPLDRVKKALHLDVTKSFVSQQDDLKHIKNAITGQQPIDAIPLDTHQGYDELNNYLRGRFLNNSFVKLLQEDNNNNNNIIINYCEILKKSSIKQLIWNIDKNNINNIQIVSESLPEDIHQIILSLNYLFLSGDEDIIFDSIF